MTESSRKAFVGAFAIISVFTCTFAIAELRLPHFFSDHMVLQRERDVTIWGKAAAGAEVTVAFAGESASVKADSEGRWRVVLPSGKAHAQGRPMTIASAGEKITLRDVLVGEVWFASGQSNMVFTMNRVPAYADVIKDASFPQIRMFNAPTVTSVEPMEDIEGEWSICSPSSVPQFSAVAYFFARRLHDDLGVPIGVIKSAWGGKPVETFTSRQALRTLAETRALVDAAVAADAKYDPLQAKSLDASRLKKWEAAIAAWQSKPAVQRGRRPRKPLPLKRPLDSEGQPGVLFNSMIHPFVGYAMRGAIWYQGESNAKPGAVPYDQSLPLLIKDWRTRWQNDFSFYFVQLANFRAASTEPGNNDPWPLLQDRMRRILQSTDRTGMAITNDIGEANDIHPKNKRDVGERLALWALAKDYDRNIVFSGPLYRSSRVANGQIEVMFDHVGAGLKSRDGGKLQRFEIAGADKVWHWADAKITRPDTVIVRNDDVGSPVAVRYAWAANPAGANLVNSAGLPASVFRTDDWRDVEVTPAAGAAEWQQRRALANEITALAAKKATVERGSREFRVIPDEQRQLLKQVQASSPDRR